MTLAKFFEKHPRGYKQQFAAIVGITPTWLGLLIGGSRKPSPKLAKLIEKKTDGKVTAEELRPDLFG